MATLVHTGSKIIVEVLDGEISRNNAGYKFQRCVRKNEEQSARRQLLYRKEGAGRKKQYELPTLSFPCLDSGKRKGEGDRLDSLGPSQLSRSLRGVPT